MRLRVQMYQAPPFRLSYKVRVVTTRCHCLRGKVPSWRASVCERRAVRNSAEGRGGRVQGLGEPLCFVAYGPLATNAFYYAMAAAATHTPTALSAAVMAACVLVRVAPTCMSCNIHSVPARTRSLS